MKYMLSLLVLLTWAVAASAAPAELPAEFGNLERTWLLRTDPNDVGEREGWHQLGHDDSAWRTIDVPGLWEPQGVTEPRPGKPPKPKGKLPWTDYDGVAWYRLRFVLPQAWAGRELVLHLGRVDDHDRTFVNGQLVGETGRGIKHPSTVSRTYLVPNNVVRYGQENVLAVRDTDLGGPGGMTGPMLSLLPKDFAEGAMKLPQSDRPLAERFANPPAASRILKIVHKQPDKPEQQDTLIQSLAAQGFGGMATNVWFRNGYVENEDNWTALVSAVNKAKGVGMSLWLYDESGYPSGAAGGITLRGHPEWQARGWLVAEAVTSGERVELAIPPGRLVRAAAFPVTPAGIDMAKAIELGASVADGKLVWQPPAGQWHAMAITQGPLHENTHASFNLFEDRPFINMLMPEPTARFIEVTHARYAEHLGDDLGQWFVATFTDEPSLMSVFGRPMPYRPLPWSPNFPTEFRRRRGYAIEPLVPALIADAPGSPKVRYDFWLTVGELVAENFFGQIQQWCRTHGFQSGGHLLCEEGLVNHVGYYGDFFRCIRRLDAPSMDCLTSLPPRVPWHVAKFMGSAAELEGRTATMCETSDHVQRYRRPGDTRPVYRVSTDEIRGTCNRLILGGINTITSYYSFGGLSSRQLRALNQWVGRCSTMLTGGRLATDLALVYPIESVWPRYRPARRGPTDSAAALQVQTVFQRTTDALYNSRRDFIYVDSDTLVNGKIADGKLTYRGHAWPALVLPAVDTLPLAAWENVAALWRQGGVVVAIAARPANSEAKFPSPRVQAIAAELFPRTHSANVHTNAAGGVAVFLPMGADALLPIALDATMEPDVRTADPRSPLRATHRRIDEHDVYFVINDSAEPCEDTLTLRGTGSGELWDPASGKSSPLAEGPVEVALGPYGGVFFRFAAARPAKRFAPSDGGLPGLAADWLPAVEPSVSKGKFVQAEVSADSRSGFERPGWRALGTLTKGQVDTFLFLNFTYPKPLDLSAAHVLLVDAWVPPGQKTHSELLLIVRDQDGDSHYAHTGKMLGAEGLSQICVPIHALKPAGWTRPHDGKLDLAQIATITIGWGGYYGEEKEAVEFAIAPPRAGRLATPR